MIRRAKKKSIALLVLAGILVLWCAVSFAREKEEARRPDVQAPNKGTYVPAALYPVYFFKQYLSNADSDRCPMHPTCSSYCVSAVKKHGALLGWIMTCDRLMRCGRDELKRSPPVLINGQKHCYDPIGNNDFWWVK